MAATHISEFVTSDYLHSGKREAGEKVPRTVWHPSYVYQWKIQQIQGNQIGMIPIPVTAVQDAFYCLAQQHANSKLIGRFGWTYDDTTIRIELIVRRDMVSWGPKSDRIQIYRYKIEVKIWADNYVNSINCFMFHSSVTSIHQYSHFAGTDLVQGPMTMTSNKRDTDAVRGGFLRGTLEFYFNFLW